MAYQSGTATSYLDLWNKFITFITADPELVADGENWTMVWALGDSNSAMPVGGEGCVLKGPGLSATDEVYIALQLVNANVGADRTSIRCRGMTNYNPAALSWTDHINVSPASSVLFMRGNNTMDYWFSANGRRFIIGVRNSTVYGALYAGLFLPYVLPDEYPYPLFVGGMGLATLDNWQSTADTHAVFNALFDLSADGNYMLDPSGVWQEANGNYFNTTTSVLLGPQAFGTDNNFYLDYSGTSSSWNGYFNLLGLITKTYGDEWILTPITLSRNSGADACYGALDGFYHVPGRGQTVENIVNVDGIDHIVLQNGFRTGTRDFFAFALGAPGSNS